MLVIFLEILQTVFGSQISCLNTSAQLPKRSKPPGAAPSPVRASGRARAPSLGPGRHLCRLRAPAADRLLLTHLPGQQGSLVNQLHSFYALEMTRLAKKSHIILCQIFFFQDSSTFVCLNYPKYNFKYSSKQQHHEEGHWLDDKRHVLYKLFLPEEFVFLSAKHVNAYDNCIYLSILK